MGVLCGVRELASARGVYLCAMPRNAAGSNPTVGSAATSPATPLLLGAASLQLQPGLDLVASSW